MPENERRVNVRYNLELLVKVKWTDTSGDEKEETATTENISSSGAFMICSSEIRTGAPVDLEIELPITLAGRVTRSYVSASGRVVRHVPLTGPFQGNGYAVAFDRYRFLRSESSSL
jgi:hypothetical protein